MIALHPPRLSAAPDQDFVCTRVVAFCHKGVQVDISGLELDRIEPKVKEQILIKYPRLSLKARLTDCLRGVVRQKPKTTYDNFMRDCGGRYVSGYHALSSVNRLERAPFEG